MNADYALGFSLMKREDESLRDYAMSFSPLAPFFGVPYRFAAFLKLTPDAAMPFPVAPPAAETPAPALAAPAKAKKAASRATAKARDVVEAEIDAGAAVAEAMAATAAPAIPDDMAEAAPGGTEALEPVETIEAATEAAETAAESTAETAVETTAEAVADTATAAPALLYDAAPDVTDDLKLIKGVGPKLEAELNGMGIYTFAQVASMNEANLAWIDDNLTTFKGRSVRDDWIGQANKLLAS